MEEIEISEQEKLMNELWEKAKELSKQHDGANVVPLYYLDPINPEGAPIVGFIKEPNRVTKAAIGDEVFKSTFRGALAAFEACIMKDVSDPRFFSQSKAYDQIIFAAGIEASAFVKLALNQIKKK